MERKWDAHRRSHSIQRPSDENEHLQNSVACVDGHHAAVQQKDTAHAKLLAKGAKKDMKLKYRTMVLEVLSRLPRRDRVSHNGWKTSGDHAVAELSRKNGEEAYRYFQPSK